MTNEISYEFDWTSIVDYMLLDAERERIGRVVAVVADGAAANCCVRVESRLPESRGLLVAASRIGIVGNGWVMLDEPIRALRDFGAGGDLASFGGFGEDTHSVVSRAHHAATAAPCPRCGSVTQI